MSGRSLSGFDPAALARFGKKLDTLADGQTAKGSVATSLARVAPVIVQHMRDKIDETERGGGTGHLKQSVRMEFAGGGTQVLIKAGGPLTTKPVKHGHTATFDYALAEEYGTAKEAPRPFFFSTFRADKQMIIDAVVFDMAKTIGNPEAHVAEKSGEEAAPGTSYGTVYGVPE